MRIIVSRFMHFIEGKPHCRHLHDLHWLKYDHSQTHLSHALLQPGTILTGMPILELIHTGLRSAELARLLARCKSP